MSNPDTGKFCWNELATPDREAAKKFYHEVLGWEFSELDMGDMTYTMIKKGDTEFAGMWQIPKDQQENIPPHWMAYVLVDNLQETLKKAQQAGANVVVPITKAGNFGEFVVITDPSGAHIAFWQSLK